MLVFSVACFLRQPRLSKMTISKNNKMMSHLNYRMKVALLDDKGKGEIILAGSCQHYFQAKIIQKFIKPILAFDKHMNILLSDSEEIRKIRPKPGKKATEGEEKRSLGLVLLRGEHIVSMTVDGPPPKDDDSVKLPKAGGLGGPGTAKPAGRGMPMMAPMPGAPPPGLQGAVRGIGGPGISMMQPGYGIPAMPPMGGPPPPRPPPYH